MFINQVGLISETYFVHVGDCYLTQFFFIYLFSYVKVQGDVGGVGFYFLVLVSKILKPAELVMEIHLLRFSMEVAGQEAFCHASLYLVLIVAERSPEVFSADDPCNHFLLSSKTTVNNRSVFSPTSLYCCSTLRAWNIFCPEVSAL